MSEQIIGDNNEQFGKRWLGLMANHAMNHGTSYRIRSKAGTMSAYIMYDTKHNLGIVPEGMAVLVGKSYTRDIVVSYLDLRTGEHLLMLHDANRYSDTTVTHKRLLLGGRPMSMVNNLGVTVPALRVPPFISASGIPNNDHTTNVLHIAHDCIIQWAHKGMKRRKQAFRDHDINRVKKGLAYLDNYMRFFKYHDYPMDAHTHNVIEVAKEKAATLLMLYA